MKRFILLSFIFTLALAAYSARFDRNFYDSTLRVDVNFHFDPHDCSMSVDTVTQWSGWYGRRVNLTRELYPEQTQILVIDSQSGDTLYVDSKIPVVLAETHTPGTTVTVPLLVPKPKSDCNIVVNLYNYGGYDRKKEHSCSLHLSKSDLANMTDSAPRRQPSYRTIRKAKDPKHCVNLAIVAEGYTESEAEKFFQSAIALDSALFVQQPGFNRRASDFNVVAVMTRSDESGISVPSKDIKVNSALQAHFDSFGLERLMTITGATPLWDALEGIPAQHILIIANTDKYGGSGSYNDYAIASANIREFPEILIHEFGHSFLYLGDEYEAGYDVVYTPDVEPLEPNITTLKDFSSKWVDLVKSGEASLFEGAGYQSHGVYRGCNKCLMRNLPDTYFCPVCALAVNRTVDYYTKELKK